MTQAHKESTISVQQLIEQIISRDSKQKDTISISSINTKLWSTIESTLNLKVVTNEEDTDTVGIISGAMIMSDQATLPPFVWDTGQESAQFTKYIEYLRSSIHISTSKYK